MVVVAILFPHTGKKGKSAGKLLGRDSDVTAVIQVIRIELCGGRWSEDWQDPLPSNMVTSKHAKSSYMCDLALRCQSFSIHGASLESCNDARQQRRLGVDCGQVSTIISQNITYIGLRGSV